MLKVLKSCEILSLENSMQRKLARLAVARLVSVARNPRLITKKPTSRNYRFAWKVNSNGALAPALKLKSGWVMVSVYASD